MFTFILVFTIVALIVFCLAIQFKHYLIRRRQFKHFNISDSGLIFAFFHPYCHTGGGGERVLWTGISAILQRFENVLIYIYTNEAKTLEKPAVLFQSVQDTFGLDIANLKHSDRILFVPLISEPLLKPGMYKHFTLAGQAIGSIIAAFECIIRVPCDIYIDTTGFAFTLPVFSWLLGSVCGAYVHFPTISSDMEQKVKNQTIYNNENRVDFNHSQTISKSVILTSLKLFYYKLFKALYAWVGNATNCSLVAVNSSWTKRHMDSIWNQSTVLVYPPCPIILNSTTLMKSYDTCARQPWIVSVGQFRPEKNHTNQLVAFAYFIQLLKQYTDATNIKKYRLVLVGGCRNDEDISRINDLKAMVENLKLTKHVDFKINISYEELKKLLCSSTIYLHTMVDEHFGIGIVEGMGAGLIPVVHRSGGPLTDIIGPAEHLFDKADTNLKNKSAVGFLATKPNEYARIFNFIFTTLSQSNQIQVVAKNAHLHARNNFSEEIFIQNWLRFIDSLINS